MLEAIIFDFDGVIVDSEPALVAVYQRMAAQAGWCLSEEDYYRHYLALDDREAIEQLYRSHGRELTLSRRDELLRWKAATYLEAIRPGLPPLPGAVEFIQHCSDRFPLAIASGSLRHEVEYLLGKLGLREKFSVISTAEDSIRSKPHPSVYLNALSGLQYSPAFLGQPLDAGSCLAIEDAPAGIDAAHGAGLKCAALIQSRPREELQHADWVFQGFAEIHLEEIAAAF